MNNNSNLYLDIANLLLNNFNGLVEQHKNDFLINYIIGAIAFFSMLMAILFVLSSLTYQSNNKQSEKRNNKTKPILMSLSCIIIGIICSIFYDHRNHNRIQKIQTQTIQLEQELSIIAKKYNIENQVVNDIAQDVISCEKDNLIIQSNLNFSFECKDKKYNQYKEEFITTFDNIKKLNNAVNNRKSLIFNK